MHKSKWYSALHSVLLVFCWSFILLPLSPSFPLFRYVCSQNAKETGTSIPSSRCSHQFKCWGSVIWNDGGHFDTGPVLDSGRVLPRKTCFQNSSGRKDLLLWPRLVDIPAYPVLFTIQYPAKWAGDLKGDVQRSFILSLGEFATFHRRDTREWDFKYDPAIRD